jgi:hypothetical protein
MIMLKSPRAGKKGRKARLSVAVRCHRACKKPMLNPFSSNKDFVQTETEIYRYRVLFKAKRENNGDG